MTCNVWRRSISSARGAFGDVILAQSTVRGLTPAECDVEFLALKGLDVAEIDDLLGSRLEGRAT